jgi:hypothetical protein
MIQPPLYSFVYTFYEAPLRGKVLWYGGTGAICVVLQLHGLAEKFLSRSVRLAQKNGSWRALSSAIMWKGLAAAYQGDSIKAPLWLKQAQEMFSTGIDLHNRVLLLAYLAQPARGHVEDAREAVEFTYSEYDRLSTEVFSCSKTFYEWFKIPALSIQGEFEEAERILRNSRAIFSARDNEIYLISQFLAVLLTYYYIAKKYDLVAIEETIKRFESLGIHPTSAFHEACSYFVAKSYLLHELFRAGKVDRLRFHHALEELRSTPRHPVIYIHYHILKAHEELLSHNFDVVTSHLEKALEMAHAQGNAWVMFEAKKLQILIDVEQRQTASAKEKCDALIAEMEQKGWKGFSDHTDVSFE